MMDPTSSAPPMEARSTQGVAGRRAPSLDPRLAEDPFFYGYRWKRVTKPDGKTVSEQVPLTEEDLLDPQEGDYVSNRFLHDLITGRLGEILRALFAFREREDVLVMCDVKMLWKDPKVHRVAPDLSVIPQVKEAGRDFASFDEAKEGTRPVFVLEVVSDATEKTDYDKKPAVYQKAGVEEYFILDQKTTPWTIVPRRLSPATGQYRKVRPDKDGRVASEALEVLFEVGGDGKSLVLTDMRTGERLRDLQGEVEARRAEAEARRLAEERSQALEEENRRLRAMLEARSS